jgi:glutaredoxin 3
MTGEEPTNASPGVRRPQIQLFTTSSCAWCVMAKALLDRAGARYELIDCTNDVARRRWLVDATGRRTVPQVFIDGVPIGGFLDLAALARRGQLAPVLAGEAPPIPIDGDRDTDA